MIEFLVCHVCNVFGEGKVTVVCLKTLRESNMKMVIVLVGGFGGVFRKKSLPFQPVISD